MGRIVKLAAVSTAVIVLLLGAVLGGPASLAQEDPESTPVNDQEMPQCPPAPDMAADEALGGDAVPVCTPTEMPMPLPTDTPVPVVPTDTPQPVPTDTPVPAAPTDTPTPVPPPPTETPTPTSGSRDVPVGTLSRQLPFANPGEDICSIDLTNTGAQACDPQTYPALFKIDFGPVSSGSSVTVQIDGGKAQPARLDRLGRWDFLSAPGENGPGKHTLTLTETQKATGATLSATVTVRAPAPNSPHFLVYPRMVRAGSSAKLYMAGFPANTTLPLGVYRERKDCTAFGQGNECFELAHDLGTITTNGDGNATRDFSVPGNETATAYLIATSGLKIDKLDPSDSLKALGRPWFVVP